MKKIANAPAWPMPEANIRVPFSKDGSFFSPMLRRPLTGEYTVGKKGCELRFDSFDLALTYLQRMPAAMWRRPNAKGNWGIVTAVRWDYLPGYWLHPLEVQN